MTKADQLESAGVDLPSVFLNRTRNESAKPAQLRQNKIKPRPRRLKAAQESLELGLDLGSKPVVEPHRASIAFQLLEGTGLLAPRQATPTTDTMSAESDVPVTVKRRGEGARV
ncbi:hypothetical protein [Streptomyces sp. MZ04]|uniref:hypothetical protein n=1 Tax=Streptomyces sp. MZ04 TaxID=2559236 RepID=UPI00107E79C8|nr:hypothetical protein [Streptomyces sp. MZ04]TGB13366.1 hypothetical protein E2651_09575 [Streptomyces sp. MZ04]